VRDGGLPIATGENLHTLYEFKQMIASGGVTFPEADVTNCGMLWTWPEPTPFHLGRQAAGAQWAIRALDRLRELDLQPNPPRPILVPLADEARALIETFGRAMQERQAAAGGLLRSSFGKARGQALRLALVLEMLWWCAQDGMELPPTVISARAFAAAAVLLVDYFK
jgi:hypothetical protein